MNTDQALTESHNAEAVQAAAVATEAAQKAQGAQIQASMSAAIAEFFDRGVKEKKFIDIGRIPFICDDISGIHRKLEAWDQDRVTQTDFQLLKQSSDLTNKIVFGAIAFILIAFLGAIVALVIKK